VSEDYYLACSTFAMFPGVPIYHSRDLVNWRLAGHALHRKEHFQLDACKGRPNMFAATLRHHGGRFYLITTNVAGGGNFYVSATDPAGPWSAPIHVDQDIFDPSLFFDDDGKVYYTRRGAWKDEDIVQAEIDIATGKLTTPLRSIGKGFVSNDCEGPHLYKIHSWYYLSMGEGGSRFLHMQTIGRSKSPWGPFEPCPHNPIIAQHHAWWHPVKSIGHADLVDAPDGSWWAVFLGTRHHDYAAFSAIGRETFLAPVTWRDGWPVIDPQAQRKLEVSANLPAKLQPWPAEPARDDFDQPQLASHWVFAEFPSDDAYCLGERPGRLRLKRTCFVGRRQTELHFTATALMDYNASDPATGAGMMVYQTPNYQYRLGLTQRDGKRVAVLHKKVGDIATDAAIAQVPGEGPVELRIIGEPHRYHFAVRPAGMDGAWIELGSGLTNLIATEVAATWGGMLICLFGDAGNTGEITADFDWCEYEPAAS
jgi:alpha-N-arabinofuranosidase